jgi:uncharacterized repeat protein (TIGR01451 family)
MADLQLLDCFQPELVRLERVRFFPRQLLSAEDMSTEADYFRQKLRRHNRFLHGWGVVCGLAVSANPSDDAPWRVEIGPGYALGPYGDEIYLGESSFLDLALCGPDATTSPCEPDVLQGGSDVTGGTLYVAIKYAECTSRPVRAMPAGCACEEIACEYSRIRDSFELGCLTEPPESPALPLLCQLTEVLPCPPCPEDPWIVLASVTLPPPGVDIDNTALDNMVRRRLYSTAMLQEQVIACCCGEPPPPPEPQESADIEVLVWQPNEVMSPPGGGRWFTYRFSVRNNGESTAHDVEITDTLSSMTVVVNSIEFGTISPPGVWMSYEHDADDKEHVFHAQLGSVAPNQVIGLQFTAVVRRATPGASLTNTVEAKSSTPDDVPTNNKRYVITMF